MSITVNSKDEIVMRLVHYFVTEENYQPIVVNGIKNEIWLENMIAPYRIIRINSNYIHNKDQFRFDNYKIKSIVKQIKKKTLSFKLHTLNILLDLNEGVAPESEKNIQTIKIGSVKDIRADQGLAGLFPKLKTFTLKKGNNLDLIVNITNDINQKTEEDNKAYEKIFRPKKIVLTKAIILLNLILFVLCILFPDLENLLILNPNAVKSGEVWRLVTAAFLHANLIHLLVNMYSLSIIGEQVENFFGKQKFLLIYLVSALTGSLMSCIITNELSLGASGAIFGLLGSLAYFGYHYRVYLGSALKNQIIPVILLNLFMGAILVNIDNAAHIGGLIGGAFITMSIGMGKKEEIVNHINGIIVTSIYILFLVYLLFF